MRAALDLALDLPQDTADDRASTRCCQPITVPVGSVLVEVRGQALRSTTYHRLDAAVPAQVDVDDGCFVDAVWGAIELHRPELVRPLLDVWTTVRPDSSQAWAMTGWAHLVDGDTGPAAELLRRAVDLDPGNEDAAALLRGLVG